ncbi:hypothetical protein SASPL_106963 [Salvia splendens]|uniref:Uncharacterized protein n=1 Tax=Salvia splendens TaxID=180675 RepID=A0A8X9A6V2_SALSN|nr:hypothetical protein SASPL_106963 [Salvia splendens]
MYASRHLKLQNDVPVVHSSFQPCVEEPLSIRSWIRPPASLLHKMNDTEIFWRASFVPNIKKYPFKRTPKIAFMFLAKGNLPLAPLWERFFKGNEKLYSIYVHSLPSYQPDFQDSSVFLWQAHSEPAKAVEWGRMSMCDAERRLLANTLLDISNEWFVLLSVACIPLQRFSIVYHYISRTLSSFMGAFDEPGLKLAVDVVADTTYYPAFEQFCRPFCYVDEHYFPTMLSIKSPHLLANRSLTWVSFGLASELSRYASALLPTEQDKCRRFEEGLIYEIRSKITPSDFRTYNDLRAAAIRAERLLLSKAAQAEGGHSVEGDGSAVAATHRDDGPRVGVECKADMPSANQAGRGMERVVPKRRAATRANLARIFSSIAAVEFSGACVAIVVHGLIRDSILPIPR